MISPRYLRIAILLILPLRVVFGQDGLRNFTDDQGRTIRARIVSTDGRLVQLELEDGTAFETPVTVFSDNDQAFLREWKPELVAGSDQERVEISGVEIREGYYHKIGDDLGITGVVYENFSDDTPKVELHLKYGVQHGPYTEWYEETGSKRYQSEYYQGKQEGVTTFWYPSGKMKSQSSYKAGLQHGLATFWYESGQVKSEGVWHGGQRLGVRTEWHENGKKMSEIYYLNGKPDGTGTAWHPTGAKRMEGTWTNGYKTGTYTEWHENGQKSKQAEYDDQGIQVGDIKYWDSEGEEYEPEKAAPDSDKPAKEKKKKKRSGGLFSFFGKKDKEEGTEAALAKEPSGEDPNPVLAVKPVKQPKSKSSSSTILTPKGDSKYYVRLLGMVSLPADATFKGRKDRHEVDLDSSFVFGAAWGKDLGSYRVEIEGTYASYSISDFFFQAPDGSIRQLAASGDIEVFSLQVNNLYEMEFTPNFELYGGAGVGLAFRSAQGFAWNSKIQEDEHRTGLAWQVLTGMKYKILGRHDLMGGYRYVSYGDLRRWESLSSHNLEFGYRLNM